MKSLHSGLYDVTIDASGGLLRAKCDCEKAEAGIFCSHINMFFTKNPKLLFDVSVLKPIFLEICDIFQRSRLVLPYQTLQRRLQIIDQQKKVVNDPKTKRQMSAESTALKKEFAKLLENGA